MIERQRLAAIVDDWLHNIKPDINSLIVAHEMMHAAMDDEYCKHLVYGDEGGTDEGAGLRIEDCLNFALIVLNATRNVTAR